MMRKILSGRAVKRVLAQALAVMMAVTSAPVNALAAEDEALTGASSDEASYEESVEDEAFENGDSAEDIVGAGAAEDENAGPDNSEGDVTGASSFAEEDSESFATTFEDATPLTFLVTLEAGEGSFDLENIIADPGEIRELSVYLTEGEDFGDALFFVDEDEDDVSERTLALNELPNPNRDNYEFVCWYPEEYKDDLSGLLDEYRITGETKADDLLEFENLVKSEEKGIELFAVWKKIETDTEDEDTLDEGKEIPDEAVSDHSGEDASSESSSDTDEEEAAEDATKEDSSAEDDADEEIADTGEKIAEAASEASSLEDIEPVIEDDTKDDLIGTLNKDGFWIAHLPTSAVTYTGANITFDDLKVYNGAETDDNLIPANNYTISYKNNKNAGTATVTVTFKNNYSGKISDTFTIAKADMSTVTSDYSFAVEEVVLPYNGKAQKGVPVITYTGPTGVITKLKNGTDFTLDYPGIGTGSEFVGTADGTRDQNTYQITVTGKGNFEGSLTAHEFIAPSSVTSISKVAVTASAHFISVSAGTQPEVSEPVVSVIYKGTELQGVHEDVYAGYSDAQKSEIDYTYIYDNGKNSQYEGAKGTLTITGTGYNTGKVGTAFSGKRTVSYKITGGIEISKLGFKAVEYGQKQDVEYGWNQKLKGVPKDIFDDLSQSEKSILDYYFITGKNGTGNATYIGINGFTGTIKKTIKPCAVTASSVTVKLVQIEGYPKNTYPYVKGGVKPKADISFTYKTGLEEYTVPLIEGKDYTLSYSSNTTVGNTAKEPSVTVKGKGNFGGSKNISFKIVGQNIAADNTGIIVSAADKMFVKKPGNYATTVAITDSNGKKLVAGTDYEKSFSYFYAGEDGEKIKLVNGIERTAGDVVEDSDIVPVGATLKITVIGKGNYKGETSGYYRIIAGDIAKASIKVPTQYYNGAPCEPSYDQLEVRLSKVLLLGDEDYEIVPGSYRNNAAKGKASMTVRGKGAYGGTKTVNFTVSTKAVNDKYTVIFCGNGATSGSMKNQVIAAGKSAALTPVKYKRDGFDFAGWSTSPSGAVVYADKAQISNTDTALGKTLTLYASWQANPPYIITTHTGGWTAEGFSVKTSYSAADPTYVIPVPAEGKWPAGYRFGGWYKDSNYKTRITQIKAGSTGNLDLFAKWIPYTLTVRFDKNGGDEITGSMLSEAFSYNVEKALTPNGFKNAANDKFFAGWALSATGEAVFVDKQVLTAEDIAFFAGSDFDDVTLYAVWSSTFTISYMLEAGETLPEGAATTYTYGEGLTTLPEPSKDDHTFGGWFLDATLKTRIKSIGKKNFGNYRLYPKWSFKKGVAKDSYTITYKNVENADNSENRTSYTVADEFELKAITQVGATFEGWYQDAALKKKVTSVKKGTTGDKVFYAKWKKVRYTINYVLNVDDPESATLDDSKEGYKQTNDFSFESDYVLATAARTDDPWMAFGGWCLDPACKKYVGYFIADPYSDITLYAKWVPGTYSISFVGNNEMAIGYMPVMTGLQGSSENAKLYNLPDCGFSNPAYEFVGWSLTENLDLDKDTDRAKLIAPKTPVSNLTLVDEAAGVTSDTKARVLYAQWVPREFTITYKDGNETLAEMSPVSYMYTSPNISTTADTASGEIKMSTPAAKEGLTFVGWYKDAACETPAGQPEIPAHSYGNITLYAKWNKHIDGLPDDITTCINVLDYGAIPDDDADDSVAINKALSSAHGTAANPATVYIPAGVYDITAYDRHSIKITSYTNLLLDDNAVLNVAYKNLNEANIGMIGVNAAHDIIIAGGTIKGGKGLGFDREGVHDIHILGSYNITIANMKICDSWGDGIYLGYTDYKKCDNVKIINCEICDNRRNNISIIYADNTLIDECYIHDAKGQQPEAGVCVEPNKYADAPGGEEYYHACDGITIRDTVITTVNKGAWYYRTFYTYTPARGKIIAKNITFENCKFVGWYGNYNGEKATEINTIIDGTRQENDADI